MFLIMYRKYQVAQLRDPSITKKLKIEQAVFFTTHHSPEGKYWKLLGKSCNFLSTRSNPLIIPSSHWRMGFSIEDLVHGNHCHAMTSKRLLLHELPFMIEYFRWQPAFFCIVLTFAYTVCFPYAF
jgi:hypothetical protein